MFYTKNFAMENTASPTKINSEWGVNTYGIISPEVGDVVIVQTKSGKRWLVELVAKKSAHKWATTPYRGSVILLVLCCNSSGDWTELQVLSAKAFLLLNERDYLSRKEVLGCWYAIEGR